MTEPLVYVAGPITKGDQFLNVRLAIDAAAALCDAGFHPFVPHVVFAWHMIHPRTYEDWMEWDMAWLAKCDAVLRIPGDSPGSDRETALAVKLGIPVFEAVEELRRWRAV